MRRTGYVHLDVFTSRRFGGNPLCVFLDGRGLSTDEMQAIAREIGFSETTFLLPPDSPAAVRRVRIFTPTSEVPFAGHPAIGTVLALAFEGIVPFSPPFTRVVIELASGPTEVELVGDEDVPSFAWMRQGIPKYGPIIDDIDRIARALGIGRGDIETHEVPPRVVSTGLAHLLIPVTGLTPMQRIRPNKVLLEDLLKEIKAEGIYAFTREVSARSKAHVHARSFDPLLGVWEDAATGSAAGPLGAHLVEKGVFPASKQTDATELVIEQGIELQRPSEIHVRIEADEDAKAGSRVKAVYVGGSGLQVGRGEIIL